MSLATVLLEQARDSRRRVALRLDANEDKTGKSLVRKKRRGPPGVATPRTGGLYPLIRMGAVTVHPEGFEVRFHKLVEVYHEGTRSQPERQIVGFSARQLEAYKGQILVELHAEAVRLGISKV